MQILPRPYKRLTGTFLFLLFTTNHDSIYPAAELFEQMAAVERNGKIPSAMVPHCLKCGALMQIHGAIERSFIPNHEEKQRLEDFLAKYHSRNLVILKLGIGARNQLIEDPRMRQTANEPNATCITLNPGDIYHSGIFRINPMGWTDISVILWES
ncbi:MAG: hypothetical protein LUI07_02500 [Lachnospiraceae bacterium]|nr:hypothetical protein [Lachnospiraceae bacterium]